jgi:hypothetical protein
MSIFVDEEKKVFIQTFQDSFTIKAKEGEHKAVSRVNKNNATVFEQRYPKISGYIVNAEYVTREHNDQKYHNFNIHLSDGKETFILSLGKKSNAANAVMQTLPKVDFTKKVQLSLSYDVASKKQTLFMNQDGAGLKWSWTKDKPGQKPNWEKVTIDGEDKWDRTKEFEYFESILKDHLRPKMYKVSIDPIGGESPVEVDGQVTTIEAVPANSAPDPSDDDLPF